MRLQFYYEMLIWLKKVEHYKKLKIINQKKKKINEIKILKSYIKVETTIIKFGDIES